MRKLFMLLTGHALADYPLQGDYLAKSKDRNNPLGANGVWRHSLGAHALIHGGMVALITGRVSLGLAETAIHAATDFAKTEKLIDYDTDQAIHVACKVLWALVPPPALQRGTGG